MKNEKRKEKAKNLILIMTKLPKNKVGLDTYLFN